MHRPHIRYHGSRCPGSSRGPPNLNCACKLCSARALPSRGVQYVRLSARSSSCSLRLFCVLTEPCGACGSDSIPPLCPAAHVARRPVRRPPPSLPTTRHPPHAWSRHLILPILIAIVVVIRGRQPAPTHVTKNYQLIC